MTADGKFVLAYCHGGMVHTDFMTSVLDLLRIDGGPKPGRQLFAGQIGVRGLYVAQSRNEAVDLYLKQDVAEWLLFVDTDIIFTAENVYALLDSAKEHGGRIMAGVYFGYLNGTLWPVMFGQREDGLYQPVTELSNDRVMQIGACGMGFTLIHREVLEAMRNPDDPWAWFGHDIFKGHRMGEDITFCYRAAQKGYGTFADGRIQVKHIKSRAESIDTWMKSLGEHLVVSDEPTTQHVNGAIHE